MLFFVYLNLSREEFNSLAEQAKQTLHNFHWLADTNILIAAMSQEILTTPLVGAIMNSPMVASVELMTELHESNYHMQPTDWTRLAELRKASDDSEFPPEERKELLALLSKSQLEFNQKGSEWTKSYFAHLTESQIKMLKQLELTIQKYEKKGSVNS